MTEEESLVLAALARAEVPGGRLVSDRSQARQFLSITEAATAATGYGASVLPVMRRYPSDHWHNGHLFVVTRSPWPYERPCPLDHPDRLWLTCDPDPSPDLPL